MTSAQVKKRRERISLCLQKSVTSTSLIARELGLRVATVSNDLHWMKLHAQKWLSEHTLDGYVFETKITIEQFKDIEMDLQEMRKMTTNPEVKLKIIHELISLINMRWVMQGDGPTLMKLKKDQNLSEKYLQ